MDVVERHCVADLRIVAETAKQGIPFCLGLEVHGRALATHGVGDVAYAFYTLYFGFELFLFIACCKC